MNVVVLVGKTVDRPFNPGGDRVVVKLDVPSDRRPEVFDRIEVHCFGAVGELALAKVKPGDVLSVRGRLEVRTGRDGDNMFQELRVVGHHIAKVS